MAEGRSNSAIAESLVVTPGAVEKHITNIFAKLDLPACDDDHRRVLAVLAYLRVSPSPAPRVAGSLKVPRRSKESVRVRTFTRFFVLNVYLAATGGNLLIGLSEGGKAHL